MIPYEEACWGSTERQIFREREDRSHRLVVAAYKYLESEGGGKVSREEMLSASWEVPVHPGRSPSILTAAQLRDVHLGRVSAARLLSWARISDLIEPDYN